MTPIEEQEHRRHRERHFFLPAGALTGLGAGLIAGHPVSGILIGIGLGFLTQDLFRPVDGPAPDLVLPATGILTGGFLL